MAERVFLSFGSNVGDRYRTIIDSLGVIRELSVDNRITVSRIYETEPWRRTDQRWFLNCAASIETDIAPEILLDHLTSFEKAAGRLPDHDRWEPRQLDIDILLYGNRIIQTNRLTIPHLSMQLRMFVLVPLAEIAANLIIPGTELTISQLIETCPDRSVVRHFVEGEIG